MSLMWLVFGFMQLAKVYTPKQDIYAKYVKKTSFRRRLAFWGLRCLH